MEDLLNQIKDTWHKALIISDDDDDVYHFHRLQLNSTFFFSIKDSLCEHFTNYNETDLYDYFLKLIENCFDYKEQNRCTCSLLISETFEEWLKVQNEELLKTKGEITNDIILSAFELSVAHHLTIFSVFSKIFKFKENNELLNDKILSVINANKLNYKEKAYLLGELQLQHVCNQDKILIPLLIQNQYDSVDLFINKNIECLTRVLKLFDNLCDLKVYLKDILEAQYQHVPSKNLHKFKAKTIAAYTMKYLKKANQLALIDAYPNIKLQVKLSQLRFLISLNYDNSDTISQDAWNELIIDVVQNDEALTIQLLIDLIKYRNDYDAADKFIQIFGNNIVSKLSNSVQDMLRDRSLVGRPKQQRIVRDTYYPSELTNIVFVDNEAIFEQMLNEFQTNKADYANVIGIDCEWKPVFDVFSQEDETSTSAVSATNRLSTLQIANRRMTFIICMSNFINTVNEALINRFADLILFSSDIKKLGFGFQQDSMRLQAAFPQLKDRFHLFIAQVINAEDLVGRFQLECPDLLPTNNTINNKKGKNSKGLSELTRKCFGKELEKSECLSNWDRRPLREAQLKYAALDAYVLVKIYDFIRDRCKELNVNFEEVLSTMY